MGAGRRGAEATASGRTAHRRRVDQPAVQLRARARCGAGRRSAAAVRGRSLDAGAAGDARVGHAHDAVRRRAGRGSRVEAGVGGGQAGVESAELRPHARRTSIADDGDAEHVVVRVVLPLIELAVDEAHGRAERGHGVAERHDRARSSQSHELRARRTRPTGRARRRRAGGRAHPARARCPGRAARATRRRRSAAAAQQRVPTAAPKGSAGAVTNRCGCRGESRGERRSRPRHDRRRRRADASGPRGRPGCASASRRRCARRGWR